MFNPLCRLFGSSQSQTGLIRVEIASTGFVQYRFGSQYGLTIGTV